MPYNGMFKTHKGLDVIPYNLKCALMLLCTSRPGCY